MLDDTLKAMIHPVKYKNNNKLLPKIAMGGEKSNQKATAVGSAEININVCLLPKRDFSRSEYKPINGSETASTSNAIPIDRPTKEGCNPTT